MPPPPAPVLPQQARGGIVYQPLGPGEQAGVPLWQRATKGKLGNPVYIGAGLIAVVVLFVLAGTWGPLFVAFFVGVPEPPRAPVPTPTPPALAVRSDYARAAYFNTGFLGPAMAKLTPAATLVNESCASLSTACQSAATTAQAEVKNVEAVIDGAHLPLCISAIVSKVRAELTSMEAALKAVQKAFADNKKTELSSAMSKFKASFKPLGGDVGSIAKSMPVSCDTQAVGP